MDGVEHALDVALPGVVQDVLDHGGFSTVADLPDGRDVALNAAIRQNDMGMDALFSS